MQRVTDRETLDMVEVEPQIAVPWFDSDQQAEVLRTALQAGIGHGNPNGNVVTTTRVSDQII
jgi:hypothetical protein